MSLSPNALDDTLLLCVDMQPKFLAAVQHGFRVRRRCEFAIAAAAGLGIPVAFTEQVPQKLGNTAPELMELAPQASSANLLFVGSGYLTQGDLYKWGAIHTGACLLLYLLIGTPWLMLVAR
jgi:nicotinamidase-related amidase